jgi:AraC family transcriptional regulator of adaptative response / DNA-3-methyladenine glycosylase II
VEVTHLPERASLVVTIRIPDLRLLAGIVSRVRRVFDLGADVVAIGAHLAKDPLLAPLVSERPGLRAPGGGEGFEVGARAVLGQQITIEAGRQLLGRLARLCGAAVPDDHGGIPGLAIAFPSAEQVASADLGALGVPATRRRALGALAHAALDDPRLFRPLGSVEETVARLCAIPGVGGTTLPSAPRASPTHFPRPT